MIFSYQVNNRSIFQSIKLNLNKNSTILLTGVEDFSFELIGCIISKLIPNKEKEKHEIPQIKALMERYSGDVILEEGELPNKSIYIGPDPDRHLLFSKVKEEFIIRGVNEKEAKKILREFDLLESFYKREINYLSGGEKVKLILCLAFLRKYDCYIFHGLLPWLDKRGKNLFFKKISQIKKESCIILIEHKYVLLKDFVDRVYYYNGENIKEYKKDKETPLEKRTNWVIKPNFTKTDDIINAKNLALLNYKNVKTRREKPLLDNLTFSLKKSKFYTVVGSNGSGKSTLAKILFRILVPDKGIVFLNGKNIQDYSRRDLINYIAYISQFPERQIIYSNLKQYKDFAKEHKNHLTIELIEKFMTLPESTPIHQLTYFYKKLLLLCSLFTRKTDLVILDELDWGLSKEDNSIFIDIIKELYDIKNFSLFMICHDLDIAKLFNSNILWLKDGSFEFVGSYDEFIKLDQVNIFFDIDE